MIPSFTPHGNLPKGIHQATWKEFYKRYGTNDHRLWLLEGLRKLLKELRRVKCSAVYIDGSFVTTKEYPGDYDLCWKLDNVLVEILDPVLLNYTENGKINIEKKYRGDIRGAGFGVKETGATYLEFFQFDRDGNPKGIVKLNPLERAQDDQKRKTTGHHQKKAA